MPKKPEAIDESGNRIEYDPTSDVGQLITLLEYCRARGFQIGPTVQVNSVIVQVKDLKLDDPRKRTEKEPGIWATAGFPEGDE